MNREGTALSEKPDSLGSSGLFGTFPRTFWVANVFELFERAAYYGMNALLARYLSDKVGGGLGFPENDVGVLQSVVYAATYVIPILGGALADRYGYRRMLMLAFSLMALGYFLSGTVNEYGAIFSTLLVMAVGSGLFKPIISGTIARTTTEKTSGLGFGIYYWMINLGALIAPLVAGWLKGISYSYVFSASAFYCAAMLAPTVLVYRDPPKPVSTKALKDVLKGALVVLSDARFMLLVFIYSCFWILYFQNFGSLLWYLRDFVNPEPVNRVMTSLFSALGSDYRFKFDAEHVVVANAATIVVLQIVVSKIVKNAKPLPTMCAGILIGATGFLILSLSQHAWVFLAGIMVFTIGEMTCHPKYISYIGIIAPPDRKATYMGYAFLYGVIGSLFGSNIGGEMYHSILAPLAGRPDAGATVHSFWLAFATLGAATAGTLVLYNRVFGKDTAATRLRAQRVMLVIYALLLASSMGMLFFVFSRTGKVPLKTAIQSTIMLLVGIGGLATLPRKSLPVNEPAL